MIAKATQTSDELVREYGYPVARASTDMSAQQARELDRYSARERTEALLDEALSETFPASDPIAITPQKTDSR